VIGLLNDSAGNLNREGTLVRHRQKQKKKKKEVVRHHDSEDSCRGLLGCDIM
jgi:hypothetical protein